MEPNEIISSGLIELYCLGLASPAEVAQVEGWARQYPEVAAEIAQVQEGMESYAQAHAVAPGAAVKEKLFANLGLNEVSAATVKEITTDRVGTETPVHSISKYWRMAAAASVVLLLGSAILNVVYYNKYNDSNTALQVAQQQTAVAEESLAIERQRNEGMSNDMAVVHNPHSLPVSLKETEAAAGTNAKIFWMQNTGEVMIDASNLPDAPEGKQYQFWAIVDGAPVDGGMIITNDKGKKFRMQKMKTFGKADAFAISLEKEGGSAAPTQVVSMGKISL